MDLQLILVGLFVLAAAVYLIRQLIGGFRSDSAGCGTGCSCGDDGRKASPRLGRRRELIDLNVPRPETDRATGES
ncbi:MAG: FeoB-associated Cys-rich membrane protein [Phycisphaerae bacterium]